jgi:hypothetical protein
MSAVVQAVEGYPDMLAAWLDGLNAYLHLYVNDPDLSGPLTGGLFVEAVFDGYSPRLVGPWTPPALRGGVAVSVMDPQIFTWGGDGDGPVLRGYYVTLGLGGSLLWAWRKDGDAYELTAGAPTLVVYLTARWPLQLA